MIINQNSYTLSHDNEKINRLLGIEKKNDSKLVFTIGRIRQKFTPYQESTR